MSFCADSVLHNKQTFAWVAILCVMNSSPIFLQVSRSLVWTSCIGSRMRGGWVEKDTESSWNRMCFPDMNHEDRTYCAARKERKKKTEKTGNALKNQHTEPLKVRKVFTSSSSEKKGWQATKLINLPRARLRPSMNSRSETEVRTAETYTKKIIKKII